MCFVSRVKVTCGLGPMWKSRTGPVRTQKGLNRAGIYCRVTMTGYFTTTVSVLLTDPTLLAFPEYLALIV